MSKIIILILIVIGVGYFILRISSTNPLSLIKSTPSPTPTVENWLPSSWTQVESTANKLKLEKSVTSGLKPQIVLEKSTNPDKTDFKTYTNRLIAGAKSALPTLRYQKDNLQNDTRVLSGYYFNQKNKILISQNIFQKDNNIYTLTASYNDVKLESEINSILDSIVAKHLPN